MDKKNANKSTADGEYNNDEVLVKDNKLSNIEISLTIKCEPEVLRVTMYSALCHELTHAYEDLQRYLSYGGHIGDNLTTYATNVDIIEDENTLNEVKNIAYVMYICSKVELNALIAQSIAELKQGGKYLDYEKGIDAIIHPLKAWDYLRNADVTARRICSIRNKEIQQKILLQTNRAVTGKVFATYNDLCRFIKRLVDNSLDYYIRKVISAARIIYLQSGRYNSIF